MSTNYAIRPYQEGDEEQIVKLLCLGIEGWPRFDLECSPLEHWKWKYLDNPTGKSSIYVAVSEDEIVGVNHVIPHRIKVFDEIFYGIYAADIVVHPDFRGRGVSTDLRKINIDNALKKGFKYSYHVTSNPFLIKSFEKIRPRFPHKICNLVKIRDIDKQLEAMPVKRPILMMWGYKGAALLNYLRNIISKVNARMNPDVQIRRIYRFEKRFDKFCAAIMSQHDYILERSTDFLNWRYCDQRAGDFVVNVAEEGDEIVGFLALRINRYRPDYPIGAIVDLLVLSERADVFYRLISDALEFFKKDDVNVINCQVVKNHPCEKALRIHGFVDSRIPLQIFCNPFDMMQQFSKIRNIAPTRVYYSYGDIDSLPVSIPRYVSYVR